MSCHCYSLWPDGMTRSTRPLVGQICIRTRPLAFILQALVPLLAPGCATYLVLLRSLHSLLPSIGIFSCWPAHTHRRSTHIPALPTSPTTFELCIMPRVRSEKRSRNIRVSKKPYEEYDLPEFKMQTRRRITYFDRKIHDYVGASSFFKIFYPIH